MVNHALKQGHPSPPIYANVKSQLAQPSARMPTLSLANLSITPRQLTTERHKGNTLGTAKRQAR